MKDLDESTVIINTNGSTKIYKVNLDGDFDRGTYDEVITVDLNSAGELNEEGKVIKEKLNERYLKQEMGRDIEKAPQYLASLYYNDYIFVQSEGGASAYSVAKDNEGIKLQEVPMEEARTISGEAQQPKKQINEQSRLQGFKSMGGSLVKKLEERFLSTRAR